MTGTKHLPILFHIHFIILSDLSFALSISLDPKIRYAYYETEAVL